MRTFYETDIRKRVKVLSFVLAGWGLVVAARLVQIQVFWHAEAKAAVLIQARDVVKVEPRRGDILDRNLGILACSLPAPSVIIRPVDKESPGATHDKIVKLQRELGLSAGEAAYVLGRLRNGSRYTYVKKKIRESDAARVMALRLPGVGLEAGTRRHYPLGPLAAHVLGGVGLEDDSRNGVEFRFNGLLKGEMGEQIDYKVRSGRGYETRVIKAPVPGKDLVLTIDATIQYIAEKELARAVAAHAATWGTVIIMEPASGEILAMASVPAYNVNDFPGPKEAWLNRAVQVSYEPGSTFKIITAAAARERNRVGYSEVFDCSAGSIRVGGTKITDHERFQILSFPQVLIKSSNVGTALFAQRLSAAEFYEQIKAFGIGTKTGITLPAEETGLVHPVADWKKSSLAHVAIGYEIMVTPIQMLQAMNVFATGGRLVRPRIVRGDGAADGDSPARVIGEKTAADLVERVFRGVVEEGTAELGRLDGFGAAGKTGTAQKYDRDIGSYTKTYTASFVGFTPIKEPRLSMIVVLDEPKEGYYGGQVCAPVFKDIARQALRYLRVPPERPLPPGVLTAGLRKEREL